MKILIAEDEFTTRMTVQVCLENLGYRVDSVPNGVEAWELLKKPDSANIAILDWEMPGLDGVDVCRRLKELEVGIPVYVILLTARDSNTSNAARRIPPDSEFPEVLPPHRTPVT